MNQNVQSEKGADRNSISSSWLRRSAVSLFASKIIANATVLISGVLLLRYLAPADYGFYQVVLSIASFTVLVFGFGFSPVVARFVPELLERGNPRAAARFVTTSIAIRVFTIAILLPVGFLFFDSIESFFGLQEVNAYGPLAIVAVVLGIYLGSSIGPVVLGAYGHQAEIGFGAAIGSVLRVLTVVIVVVMDYGLIGILIAISSVEITMMLGYLIRLFMVVKSRPQSTSNSPFDSLRRRAFRYSVPNTLMSALSFFESRFGMIFVISTSIGTAAVGNYSFVFAMMQFGAIVNPVYTLNTLIDNVIVRRSVHVDQKLLLARGQKMFLTLTAYTSIPVALYLILLRAPLSQLFGFEQAGTGWLFLWSGIFFVTNSVKLAYANIFTQLEVPKYRILFGAIGLTGVGIAVVVVERYGIVGVAAIAAGSSLVVVLVQHWISRQILEVPVGVYPAVWIKIVVINALAGLATSTVVFVSDRFVPMALITSFVFIAVYAVGTFVIRPFSKEDVKLVRSILPAWLTVNPISHFK